MTSEIQAMLTVRYGEFINPLPEVDTLAKDMPFVPPKSRNGRSYNFPVQLSLPHGVTHSDTHTAFSLSSVVAPTMGEATITGAEILVRDNVAYADVFATRNGIANGGGQGGAYMDVWDYKTKGLMKSGGLYRELALGWGPGSTSTLAANLGVIDTAVSGADLAAGQVVNFTRATMIPGLWPMMNNAIVDVYQSDLATVRAVDVTLTSPVKATNRVTLTKAGSAVVVAAGDVIVARDALDVSCYGIDAIMANTGTLFGISASANPQWQSDSYAVGSDALTRLDVITMGTRLYAAGLRTGANFYVAGPAFGDLAEEAAELLRSTPDSNDVVTQGATRLIYRTAAGPIEVVCYPYQKQSIGWVLPKGLAKRTGETDLTFDNGQNQWFYSELADSAGAQLRIYSNQAPIIEIPWHSMRVTGIQSTGDTLPA